MDFKVAQPTDGRSGSHASMTSEMFAPYVAMDSSDNLWFTQDLYKTSHFNINLVAGDPWIYTPCIQDILTWQLHTVEDLDPLSWAFVWHLRAILVQQEPSFAEYMSQLSAPEAVDVLPVMQTIQFPASAINADEGQSNGNWQVLVNMLEQSGVLDARLEEDVILVHGNLSMKEWIDSLWKMHTIEHSSKNCLDFVVFIPGLFHLKMAATDAFWHAQIQLREGRGIHSSSPCWQNRQVHKHTWLLSLASFNTSCNLGWCAGI